MPMSRADFGNMIADETGKWAKVVEVRGHQAGVSHASHDRVSQDQSSVIPCPGRVQGFCSGGLPLPNVSDFAKIASENVQISQRER